MKVPRLEPNQGRAGVAVLALLLGLALGGGAQAGDAGARHHAEGRFDAATATYEVTAGDDLAAIAERFGVSVPELKAANRLGSDTIEVGQRLVVAASTSSGAAASAPPSGPQVTGVLGSPSATTTISGKQLPPPRPEVRRRDQGRRPAIEALVGAAHRAAQGGAQRPADHHRRLRLRRAEHLRRRHPDADDGSHRARAACATTTSTPPRSARRRAPR